MLRKPPYGYESWISFHDAVLKEYPEILNKNILIQHMSPEGKVTKCKYSFRTIQRNCWVELQTLRPTRQQAVDLFRCSQLPYYTHTGERFPENIRQFLIKTCN